MAGVTVEATAWADLTEIYDFTRRRWDERQADRYISGLFATFRRIADETVPSRPVRRVSADARVSEYEAHLIYWTVRDDGNVGIVAVLHERMDQLPGRAKPSGPIACRGSSKSSPLP